MAFVVEFDPIRPYFLLTDFISDSYLCIVRAISGFGGPKRSGTGSQGKMKREERNEGFQVLCQNDEAW